MIQTVAGDVTTLVDDPCFVGLPPAPPLAVCVVAVVVADEGSTLEAGPTLEARTEPCPGAP